MRESTDFVLEMVEGGELDPIEALKMCLKWMSDDDVEGMINANELRCVRWPEELMLDEE
jgi:hypothetical protein